MLQGSKTAIGRRGHCPQCDDFFMVTTHVILRQNNVVSRCNLQDTCHVGLGLQIARNYHPDSTCARAWLRGAQEQEPVHFPTPTWATLPSGLPATAITPH